MYAYIQAHVARISCSWHSVLHVYCVLTMHTYECTQTDTHTCSQKIYWSLFSPRMCVVLQENDTCTNSKAMTIAAQGEYLVLDLEHLAEILTQIVGGCALDAARSSRDEGLHLICVCLCMDQCV